MSYVNYVEKIWGSELWITNTDLYCGKQLFLKRNMQCSLHYHEIKDETFHVMSGMVRLELGEELLIMVTGDTVRVPPGTRHRFAGLQDSVILEISTRHSDEDVTRIEDSGFMTS